MNTNEQPNQATTEPATQSPDSTLAFSIQPLALPAESLMARNAAAYLAAALQRLAAQPDDIQAIIRPFVEKHYPDTHRRANAINFDNAKANCIHTRINHETALKQKREAIVGDDVRSLTPPASSPQSEISNLKSAISSSTGPATGSKIPPQPLPQKTQPVPTGSNPVPACPNPVPAGSLPVPAGPKTASPFPAPFAARDPFSSSNSSSEDETTLLIAEEFETRVAGKSPLDQLPEHIQQAIIDLLAAHSAEHVGAFLARPHPHGCNFKTSKTALNLFRHRYQNRAHETKKKEHLQNALATLHRYPADKAALLATEELLSLQLFKSAALPNPSIDQIDKLIIAITRLRKQHLAERKQTQLENHQSK